MDSQVISKRSSGKRKINKRKKTLWLCVFILVFILIVYLNGLLIPYELVTTPDFSQTHLMPSAKHPFGTDWLGRDMLLRTVKGLSTSLTIGVTAVLFSGIIAAVAGTAAATGSKKLDSFVNWLIDLIMGIPHIVLLILISLAFGKGSGGLIIGIALTHWTSLARLIRGEVLQIRSQQYIAVSRKFGKSSAWIFFKHIFPHMLPQFIVGLILLLPHAIMHESAITFLGYGLPPEKAAIGLILADSMKYLSSGMWWLALFPGIALVLTVVLFEKLGDNLKTLLDPYSAHE